MAILTMNGVKRVTTGFDLYAELFVGRITCDVPQDVSNWLTKSFYYADSAEWDYLGQRSVLWWKHWLELPG